MFFTRLRVSVSETKLYCPNHGEPAAMKMHWCFAIFLALVGIICLSARGTTQEPQVAKTTGEVHFNRDIRPILANRCFKCHGPDLKKGGLNLQRHDSAL